MYRLWLFLQRIYLPVIFLALEGMALGYYANSTVHSRARLLSISDRVVGSIYGGIADAENYLSLGRTNRLLAGRVQALEDELASYREYMSQRQLDSIAATVEFPMKYIAARVVRNSTSRRENYIMVDKGERDGVERGMAVVSLDGCMVGYVESVSGRNAVCVSVLSSEFRGSGMLKGKGDFGSVSWPGEDLRMVKLSEVPKYAGLARGDTIVTSGYSFNFPEGIHIGTIEDFVVDDATASYNIDVRLGVDIAALRVVMLVKNPRSYEFVVPDGEVDAVGGGDAGDGGGEGDEKEGGDAGGDNA